MAPRRNPTKPRECPPCSWSGWAAEALPLLVALRGDQLPARALRPYGGRYGWLQVLAWCEQHGLAEEAGGRWRLTTAGWQRAKVAA
jgi:hypothetical protein